MRAGLAPLNPLFAFHAIFCNLCVTHARLLLTGIRSPGAAIISVAGTFKPPGWCRSSFKVTFFGNLPDVTSVSTGVEARGPFSSSVPMGSSDSDERSFVEFALMPCGVYHTPFSRSGQETV